MMLSQLVYEGIVLVTSVQMYLAKTKNSVYIRSKNTVFFKKKLGNIV